MHNLNYGAKDHLRPIFAKRREHIADASDMLMRFAIIRRLSKHVRVPKKQEERRGLER